ncbi:MAG: hypothetical protein HXY26_07700 [Hydrogenophilaceae bacterium]|nr:hypothetical protein [Hydrogenophilaceae bacterium]
MAMIYTLHNINVDDMATAVLVKNALDSTATKPCGTSQPENTPSAKTKKTTGDAAAEPSAPTPAPPAPSFIYCPWQFLNPSRGAEEGFTYNNSLSVVIKKSSGAGTIQSKRVPVQLGSSYMLVIGEKDIQLQTLPQNGKGYVELVTPTPSVDPFTVNIEWHLSDLDQSQGRCIGITQNIGPDTSAFFQPDNGTLLFFSVAANAATQTYAPSDIPKTATAYQPPNNVIQVGVTLEKDATGLPAYTFDRLNAAVATQD